MIVNDSVVYDEYPEEDMVVNESPVVDVYVESDAEDVIYEGLPVEEVYLDENLEDLGSDGSLNEDLDDDSSENSVEDDLDDADGWGEYIEEEFGDSLNDSEGSDEKN